MVHGGGSPYQAIGRGRDAHQALRRTLLASEGNRVWQGASWDSALVASFLKDDRFLLASPNVYNALGVGTTQLYNKTVVYNHKRHGEFMLGGRTFEFRQKPTFPKQLTREFLLVDLVNNLGRLAESEEEVLARVKEKARTV